MIIESSTGHYWNISENDNKDSIVDCLLANRGISPDVAVDFLKPTLHRLLPDPYVLLDMEKGVNRLYSAIINNEKFVIVGDYDVDGVTSTALLVNYLHDIGYSNFEAYIPHRILDGYGLNKNILDKFDEKLIITTDNGSTAYDAIEYAKGRDIIIIDHHTMPKVADVIAVINPHRPDEKNDNLKILCAAGVMYLFIIALNRKLRKEKFFYNAVEPDLKKYIDIVALGTTCDAMPMLGLNRAFVSYGIKHIKNTRNVGLKHILNEVDEFGINEETFGFFIGPRLNAAGRLDSASISLELLTCNDDARVQELTDTISKLNMQRQAIETLIMDDIHIVPSDNFICAYHDSWHVGVIGIIAGKLKEMYNLPTFVISFDKEGIGHGSARSVPNVDLSSIIRKTLENGILLSGGGHKLAAGFSIVKDNIFKFIEFLRTEIITKPMPKEFMCDGYVSLNDLTFAFVNDVMSLAPFGEKNNVPNFILSNVKVKYISVIGRNKSHLSVTLADELGHTLRCVSFNSASTELGRILLSKDIYGRNINVLGSVSINHWNGSQRISMNIIDVLT